MNARRNPKDIDQEKETAAWELAMEQRAADETLQNMSAAELYEFISGNPCPARDSAEYSSDETLPRLIEAVIAGILSEPVGDTETEDFQLEMMDALLGGLISRLHRADSSVPASLPEALSAPLVKALLAGVRAVAARLQAKHP